MDRRSNTSTSTWVRKRSHPCMDDGLLHATAIGVGSLHASVHHEMVGRAWSEATPDPDLTTSNKQTSAWPNRSFSVLVASVRAGSWVLLVGSGTGCSSPLAHVPHVIHLVARASDKCCCLQLCSLCQSSLGVADQLCSLPELACLTVVLLACHAAQNKHAANCSMQELMTWLFPPSFVWPGRFFPRIRPICSISTL
jgi:hypothetical protein